MTCSLVTARDVSARRDAVALEFTVTRNANDQL